VRVWPIFKKEMRLYFTLPVAYVVLTIFLVIAGWFFYNIFTFFTLASMQSAMNPAMARELNVTDSVMRPLVSNISVILLLLMPLVTMRLFSEERRSGTIELLLTYPVRDGAVLVGKYLAALALYALMLALTLLYPGIVVYFARLEWGPLATAYVGLLLMGGTFIAVGIFASIIAGSTCCMHRNGPVRFTASIRSQSERLISTNSSVTRSSETTQYNVTNPRRIVLGTITARKPISS